MTDCHHHNPHPRGHADQVILGLVGELYNEKVINGFRRVQLGLLLVVVAAGGK